MRGKSTLKTTEDITGKDQIIEIENIRLYDAIMAIIYRKGKATYEEIIYELEKLKTKNLISYKPEDVATVLVLASTMKVLKNGDGSFKLVIKPQREYKKLLEQISKLFDEKELNGDAVL
ncbi:MAG: hypothetical protein GSR72_05525 [Desulfurococcales archaeon]|nr:hypothetical protein [Desulfurococcales archaeon]